MKVGHSIIFSLGWGLGVAAILGAAAPLLLLSEMAGPNDFFVPVFAVSMLGLIITAFTSRVVGGWRGALCGMAFTCPVIIVSYFIANYDPTVLYAHGLQLGRACYLTLVVSVVVMAFRGKTNAWAKNGNNEP